MPSATKADDLTIGFPPHRGVGISKTSLWASWKEVRKRVRDASWRDIVDFAEFDIEPDKWIAQLLSELRSGRYQPQQPRRFPLAKSKGFSRWMTLPDGSPLRAALSAPRSVACSVRACDRLALSAAELSGRRRSTRRRVMPTAPRILEHIRYMPLHISAGLGGGGDFVTIRTRRGVVRGVCAFDADQTKCEFELSTAPYRENWYAPMKIVKIAYSEILEIRCGDRTWVPTEK